MDESMKKALENLKGKEIEYIKYDRDRYSGDDIVANSPLVIKAENLLYRVSLDDESTYGDAKIPVITFNEIDEEELESDELIGHQKTSVKKKIDSIKVYVDHFIEDDCDLAICMEFNLGDEKMLICQEGYLNAYFIISENGELDDIWSIEDSADEFELITGGISEPQREEFEI